MSARRKGTAGESDVDTRRGRAREREEDRERNRNRDREIESEKITLRYTEAYTIYVFTATRQVQQRDHD